MLAACSSGTAATTSVSIPADATTTTTYVVPESPLAGFDVAWLRISGEEWLVAVADTPALRERGLMGIDDLGELDGMLFEFDTDTTTGFWMKDTLIPLDIAFFDVAGVLVDTLSMVPCETETCERYVPSGPYRRALEARPGAFAAMDQPSLQGYTRIVTG